MSSGERVRVLVVAASRLYRDGIAQALAASRFEVTGTASTAAAALARVAATGPDVTLVDLGLPSSLQLVRAIRDARPQSQVVALSVPDAEEHVIACAEAGAAGFVTLDGSLDDLEAMLESVGRGETLCSPRMVAALFRRVASLADDRDGLGGARLTARERQILEHVARGRTNKEIATALQIELPTVKNHVHNILEKLHVTRRSDAAARFRGDVSAPLARPG
jgi:two-component system, NarL family, nitrate/nitrite response regulator NarL